jgi:signal transduction histidine kinase
VDLNATLQAVLSDLDVRLSETGGRVEAPAPLPTVDADPVQMHQLLLNLIGNALKFHREDVPPLVTVTAAHTREGLRLSVEDNGIGFDNRHAERIFAPFQRLHARGEYEGTGMGLAIVRRIVERHGGAITAESTPNEGSRFELTLPRHPERVIQ